jgi:thiamine biosynthesis lipoprotein
MKQSHLFRICTILLCLALTLSLASCGKLGAEYRSEIFAMDTVMTLVAYGPEGPAGLNAGEAVIRSMEAMLDPELDTSVVYKLNHAHAMSVSVPVEIAGMFQTAKTVYDSCGQLGFKALDLSIYPLVKLWGFVDGNYYIPGDLEIAEARARLQFDQIILSSFPSSGSYELTLPETCAISFGAVAKGAAAGYVIEAMKNAGVSSAIISLGGNVQTLGLKPDGSKWAIGITDPNDSESYLGILSAEETAVVTSGSYQRCFTDQITGKTYHHIIDPRTGRPCDNTLLSVTIICQDGALADALSTALFVLGEKNAIRYWQSFGKEDKMNFQMILINKDDEVIATYGLIDEFSLENPYYTLRFIE